MLVEERQHVHSDFVRPEKSAVCEFCIGPYFQDVFKVAVEVDLEMVFMVEIKVELSEDTRVADEKLAWCPVSS